MTPEEVLEAQKQLLDRAFAQLDEREAKLIAREDAIRDEEQRKAEARRVKDRRLLVASHVYGSVYGLSNDDQDRATNNALRVADLLIKKVDDDAEVQDTSR